LLFLHLLPEANSRPPAVDTRTDAELIADLSAGNPDAFGELYRRYRTSLFAFCVRMAGDRTRAGDLLHDVFLKLYQSASTIRETGALRIWLYRVARNEVLMSIRQKREVADPDPDLVWDGETPLTILETAEESRRLERALGSLKAEYREVLLLREEEGLSYAEIATITGDSESSVKSRLFKARRALANLLVPRATERKPR
jgi:RNA polymerase sigma-70 factor (ECF subfamily)